MNYVLDGRCFIHPCIFSLIQDSIQDGSEGEEDPEGHSAGGDPNGEEKNSLSVRVSIIRNVIHFVHDYVSTQSFISFNLHSCLLT